MFIKLFSSAVLCSIIASTSAQENAIPDNLRGVSFTRQSFGNGTYSAKKIETYQSSSAVLPAWPGSDRNRGYLTHQMATYRPPGTSVMWATFSFQSKGLFTAAPGAHVLFIVRSVSTGISNIGQGLIIGGLSEIPQAEGGACQSGTRAQPEVWHETTEGAAGNRVYGGSYCSPLMQDWVKYTVTVHAGATGYAYWIKEAATGVHITGNYIDTSSNPSLVKQEKASGFTAGIVFADVPGTSWEFEVTDLTTGWF